MTIIEFLTARLDDEASTARDMAEQAAMRRPLLQLLGGGTGIRDLVNPDRILADVAAKRAIVSLHTHPSFACYWSHDSMEQHDPGEVCDTLCALAQPYADHPDYREEWKP
jgi:hypothetical protein